MENIPRGIRVVLAILFWLVLGIGGSIAIVLLLGIPARWSTEVGIIMGAIGALGGIEIFKVFD